MGLQGWIRVHRKILNNTLWKEKPFSRGQAWITMVLLANHTPNKVLMRGELVECGRGQSVRSVETWGKLFGWSRQRIRVFFGLLEKEGMVVVEGLHYTTRLTICNYETYQTKQPAKNQPETNGEPTKNQRRTTNNNDKNANNEKNEKKILPCGIYDYEFECFWNSQVNLPLIKRFTKSRKHQLQIRSQEPIFRENWKKIIEMLAASDFHVGKNDRGWKANVDWILKNDTNYVKILEIPARTYSSSESSEQMAERKKVAARANDGPWLADPARTQEDIAGFLRTHPHKKWLVDEMTGPSRRIK